MGVERFSMPNQSMHESKSFDSDKEEISSVIVVGAGPWLRWEQLAGLSPSLYIAIRMYLLCLVRKAYLMNWLVYAWQEVV